MDILTRMEELLLLVVWKLEDEAYGLAIRNRLNVLTGSDHSVGAVYTPLKRMARRGFLETWEGDPTEERGGRSKRFYKLTPKGVHALRQVRSLTESAWSDLPAQVFGLTLRTS
ncbi:MAG: PadR family transcriptional regulator [Balneolaceae bacterium]|nr:PadR family transcriptional regulator [Balneolaceae bacterium]